MKKLIITNYDCDCDGYYVTQHQEGTYDGHPIKIVDWDTYYGEDAGIRINIQINNQRVELYNACKKYDGTSYESIIKKALNKLEMA